MINPVFLTEAFPITIPIRSYDDVHGVTLCCVILNEEKGIKEFLEYYKPHVKKIVMIDGGSTDRTVEIATPLVDGIQIRKFDGHYSNQANRAVEMADTDWILLMDCDERLEKNTLENLSQLTDQQEHDCWAFPRKNYMDGEWIKDDYPNYQDRLYRSYCRRVRPVHGEVVGFKNGGKVPCTDGNFIIHSKTKDRHRARNSGYLMYEFKYRHEMGEPGTQTRESFEWKYPRLNERNFRVL
jgi:glycosyltransferase involved in cell wall biosynthesis